MSKRREQLIRTIFDLGSDLEWVESLEPKFRNYDIGAAELAKYREAWNEHTERRDWEWWKDQAKSMSTSELEDFRKEYVEKIDAVSMSQEKRESVSSEQRQFQNILKAAVKAVEDSQVQSRDEDREM